MTYRPDIDGLRSIAVIAVVLYHAEIVIGGTQLFPGGFIGVDIFFVISGFLITNILVSDLENDTFSILRFYERRARRLLPALLCVMVATMPVAWLVMTPNALVEYGQSLLAALAFGSNIFFWLQDSYTAEPSQLKPFLHTWSLSLEEQYYLVFPPVLFVIWKFARDRVAAILLTGICISLTIAIFMSTRYSDANFFLMPSRAWELLLGAFIAVRYVEIHRAIPSAVLAWMPAIGIAAIVIPIVLYADTMPHPSYWTTIPVLGVAAIILSAHPANPVTRLLSIGPMVACGLISYSFYLWHFPIFAFGKIMLGGTHGTLHLLSWIALSLALAYLSWRYVEQPFRNRAKITPKPFVLLLTVPTLALAAFGSLLATERIVDRYQFIPLSIQTSLTEWRSPQNPDVRCVDRDTFLEPATWCELGDTSQAKTEPRRAAFVLAGDSHAHAFAAVFDNVARQAKREGVLISRSGCPMLIGLEPSRGEPASSQCLVLAEKVLEYAAYTGIPVVLLAVRWNYYSCGEPVPYCGYTQNTRIGTEPWAKTVKERLSNLARALENTASKYAQSGVQLKLIAQVPHQPRPAREIFADYFQAPETESIKALSATLSDHNSFRSDVMRLLKNVDTRYSNVTLEDPTDALCQDLTHCPAGNTDSSYYTDDDHIGSGAVKVLGPWAKAITSTY